MLVQIDLYYFSRFFIGYFMNFKHRIGKISYAARLKSRIKKTCLHYDLFVSAFGTTGYFRLLGKCSTINLNDALAYDA